MSNNGKIIKFDEAVFSGFDDTTKLLFPLTAREASILLSQTPFISWDTRWDNLTQSKDELLNISSEIADSLMNPQEASMFDCTDVEDCLETSITITNIENNITTVEGDVTNIYEDITTVENNITEIENDITNITENSTYNEYPEYPEASGEFNAYCGSAWALANYFHDFIQDVITDAGTITFAEFVALIIQLQGFKFTIVKALWDFVIVNINPNLSTEVTDALPKVAEHIFCNELDMAQARADIIADGTITSDAEATYVSAIDALTDAKLNELVYLGSLDESQDCSGLACGCVLYDFTKSMQGFTLTNGVRIDGEGITGAQPATAWDIIIPAMPNTFDLVQIHIEMKITAYKNTFANITPRPIISGSQQNVGNVNMGSAGSNEIRVRDMFLSTNNVNGFRMFGDNGGAGDPPLYIRKLWIRYTKVTGAPQYGAPECYQP